ncbi:hypothetical protein pb186bvf_000515 [Paramecium bursaria]
MGAQCCTSSLDKQQELVLKSEGTQSSQLSPTKNCPPPIVKDKIISKDEEAQTPGFNGHLNQSIISEIKLVREVEVVQDEDAKSARSLKSQKSLLKRKEDSPMFNFEPKNSLKSYDSKKLQKKRSMSQEHQNQNDEANSQDNRSVKSILKHELKYSQFKKQRTYGDAESRKEVRFNIVK